MADEGYPRPDLPEDASELTQRMFALLQAHMPGFNPQAAGPGTWHLEAVALAQAATVSALQRFSEYAYARLGEIDGAPLIQGSPASAASTWTFTDPLEHTVRRGTPVRLITPAGEIEMVVVTDHVKPAGQATTTPGAVELQTLDTGAELNDLTGALVLDEPVAEVAADGLALVGLTFGAANTENLDAYLGRLTRRRRLQTPRPVKAEEFAVFMLEEPDVGRVTIRDLYNPVTAATTARATTTAFVATALGERLLDGRRAQIRDKLRALVEANYDVFVEDHSYTTIDVTARTRALPGYDQAVVDQRVADAIRAHLFPGTYGIPASGDRAFAASPQTTVGYLDLAADAGAVAGLERLTSLTIGVAGSALGTTDVPMTGPAPLPRPGTITVTPA